MHPTLTEIVQHYLAKTAKRLDEPVTALSDGMSNLATAVNKRSLSDVLSGLLKAEGELIFKATESTDIKVNTLLDTIENTTFQHRVLPWLLACFGETIAGDREERNHRFLEEALELVQSTGCTQHEAHQLVDYVFNREVGDPPQEVGGVMVTLAALCLANNLDMHQCAETELSRVWTKVEQIRAKQAAKPKHSPLPQAVIETPQLDTKMKDLTFSVETDEYDGKQPILLHIDNAVILPFESITAWQKFANDMLKMIPEITDNLV